MVSKAIEEFIHNQQFTTFEWQKEYNKISSLIKETTDEVDLFKAVKIDLNKGLMMPFELMCELYEKLLKITQWSVDALQDYSQYLMCFGPEYDEKADELLNEARAKAKVNGETIWLNP